jgi:protocatechuate 3,4-dioxygenase beta subunit
LKARVLLTSGALFLACTLPVIAGSVSGRIVDSDGRPVAGARIWWTAFESPDDETVRETERAEAGRLGEITTGADGRFRVPIEKDPPLALRVEASGHPAIWFFQPYDSSEDALLPDVALAPPARMSGRIVDDQGRGVPGATVTATSMNVSFGEFAEVSRVRTAPDGSFSIAEGVAAPRVVTARAEGRVAANRVQYENGDVRLTLKPGGAIRGVVTDAAGRPASGAVVRCAGSAVLAGADGHYKIAGLPPGLQTLEATWRTDFTASQSAVRVAVANEAEVALRLARGAVIAGTVVDETTRRPIAGASVSATDADYGPLRRTARTDARGRYRIAGLGSRSYSVGVAKPGYLPTSIVGIAAAIGAPPAVNVALAPAARLAGRVLDQNGGPVPGARVAVDGGSPGRRAYSGFHRTLSAADGSYRIRNLPPGRNFLITAQKPGYVVARRAGVVLKGGAATDPVDLTMRKGLEARGRVVDSSGNPVPGAEVRVAKRENGRGPWYSFSSARPDAPDAVSAADGGFAARGLEEGEYSLTVSREGYASKTIHGLVVRPETENAWGSVTLAPGVAIAGTVRTSAGQPIPGAQVAWFPSGQGGGYTREDAATADPEGKFRVDGLTPNVAVQLTVSAEGYGNASKSATPPTEEVAFVLRAGATVRGRVEDGDTKRPVTEFTIVRGSRQTGGGSTFFMRSWDVRDPPIQSEQGAFELSNVAPGKITLQVSAAGFRTGDVTLDVSEGETKDGVVVPLRRGGSIQGRVLDGARMTGISNAAVRWRSTGASAPSYDGSQSNETATDADGKFHFDGLPAGTLTVSARHPDYAEASKDADPDKEGSIDLTLGGGATVEGVLVGRDGRSPVAAATVQLGATGGPGDTTRTDDAGAFSFEHLRPGRYRITARASEGQSVPRDLVLTDNQRQDGVLLALRGAGARIRGTVTGLPPGKAGSMRVMGFGKDWGDSTQTDDAGTFTFSDVPAGTMRFQASAAAGPSRSASRTVEVPEGASEVSVEVAFDGSSRLSGRVMRGERPVAGVWVFTTPDPPVPSSPRSSAQTDEAGKYILDGLTDGPHQVSVAGQGISYQKTLAISGDTTADIAIPASLIAGTVTDEATGDAIEGALVRAETGRESSSFSVKTALTDPAGRFEIAGADSGAYQVTASKSGYRMRTRSVNLGTETADADFVLTRGAGVLIRASDGTTGLPLREIYGIAFAASGLVAFQGSVNLDTSGRGEIPSLTPGRYALYLFATGLAPRSLPSLDAPSPEVAVAMTPGGRVDVRCDATVSGRLTDAANNTYLLAPGRIDGRLFCGPPAVAWENVAPGTYTLTLATGKTYALTVAEGQTTRLDLK